jgi:hypothetical protein
MTGVKRGLILSMGMADAMDILLKAQQEGEAEFVDGEQPPGLKVIALRDEQGNAE